MTTIKALRPHLFLICTLIAMAAIATLGPAWLGDPGAVSFGIVALAQLEKDFAAKTNAARTLLEANMRAAAEHVNRAATATEPEDRGRVMTAEEKQAVQVLLDEARELQGQIHGRQGDSNLRAELERLTSGAAMRLSSAHAGAVVLGTIGDQVVNSELMSWIQKTKGHRPANWNSPSVETFGGGRGGELRAATLTTDSASGGPLVLPQNLPGILPLLFKRLVVADLIAPGTAESNLISYMKEKTFTNAAATVAEGATKPESTLIFEAATSPVRKIAHFLPVTDEMLEDVSQIRSFIDARLKLGVDLKEEDQLLNGDGNAPNLLGLMNLPGLSAAVARGADTNMDAIFKQITAIAVATFVQPTGFVINPLNWMTIQLLKNANGNYMGAGPWAAAQQPLLWGIPGAVTPSIAAGTSLVGDYAGSAQIFRRGGIRIEASNSHSDFFVRNLTAIRAEERLALAAYREAAFGKVTGLN